MRGTKQRLAAGLALVLPMLSAWTASGTPYIETPEYTVPSKEVPWGIAEAINVAKFNEPYPLKGIEFRLTGYFDPTYSTASFQNNEDEPASFTIQMSFDLNATFPYSGGADEVMTVTPTFSEGEALAAYAPPPDYQPLDGITYSPDSSASLVVVGNSTDQAYFTGPGTVAILIHVPDIYDYVFEPYGKIIDDTYSIWAYATFQVRYYIPEPASLTVLGIGAAGLLVRRRRV